MQKAKKRVVAVFSGNRAEFGLQFPILKAIEDHPDLEYRLIISGAHLEANFGRTITEIEQSGIHVDAVVPIDLGQDDLISTSKAIGSGIVAVAEALQKIKPDIFVVYADRFESFAALVAGTQMNIPTAHIEGGDITEGGALDDSVRHAMTKLAHLHFTTNQQASNRILAMGEESWRVHTVGYPTLDLIKAGQFAKPDQLAAKFGLNTDEPIVMFTQHSVTTEFEQTTNQIQPSLEALVRLANEGVQCVITYPNNDAGGRRIISELQKLEARKLKNIFVISSLGRANFHGILALAEDRKRRIVCAGNSSAGIKETPYFGCPTVNIGSRQDSRLRGQNVLDTDYDTTEIYKAIRRCLDDKEFRAECFATENPYGIGEAGPRIASLIAKAELNPKLIQKRMCLQGEVREGWYR